MANQLLVDAQHIFQRGEAELHVQLGELGLPVRSQVLIPEAPEKGQCSELHSVVSFIPYQ